MIDPNNGILPEEGNRHMIRYALPDFTARLSFNLMFARMMHTAPELFFDDIKAECVYGCFPDCIMNGGRVIPGERASYDQISETFDAIEKEGLGIRITFTNMLIRPEHFDDEYANTILKAARGRNAKVIVNSDELGEYISNRYHLGLILSTTRELSGAEELNMMLDRYEMAVLNYNHNKDDAFLKQVSHPDRLEVMVNEPCKPGCTTRQQHYLEDSRSQMEHRRESFNCPGGCEKAGYTMRTATSPTILGNDDIRRLNKTYGIEHYKIVGRRLSVSRSSEAYLYYFVRPEYRSTMAKIIQRHSEINNVP